MQPTSKTRSYSHKSLPRRSFSFIFSTNDYSNFENKEEAILLYASTALLNLSMNGTSPTDHDWLLYSSDAWYDSTVSSIYRIYSGVFEAATTVRILHSVFPDPTECMLCNNNIDEQR